MSNFKLDNQPKIDPGFKIPEGYFESLPEKILSKTKTESVVIPLYRKSIFKLAAAVILLAVLIPIGVKTFQSSTQFEINNESIENYLSYNTDLNAFDLIGLIDEEDIKNFEMEYKFESNELETLLLQNNNIDLYLID